MFRYSDRQRLSRKIEDDIAKYAPYRHIEVVCHFILLFASASLAAEWTTTYDLPETRCAYKPLVQYSIETLLGVFGHSKHILRRLVSHSRISFQKKDSTVNTITPNNQDSTNMFIGQLFPVQTLYS
nr:hypothetical protein L204_00027 [Cryptococcus depauperatus CBS 7855]